VKAVNNCIEARDNFKESEKSWCYVSIVTFHGITKIRENQDRNDVDKVPWTANISKLV